MRRFLEEVAYLSIWAAATAGAIAVVCSLLLNVELTALFIVISGLASIVTVASIMAYFILDEWGAR